MLHEQRMAPVAAQVDHARQFELIGRSSRLWNHGRPADVVASKPLATPYHAPAARPNEVEGHPAVIAPRPAEARPAAQQMRAQVQPNRPDPGRPEAQQMPQARQENRPGTPQVPQARPVENRPAPWSDRSRSSPALHRSRRRLRRGRKTGLLRPPGRSSHSRSRGRRIVRCPRRGRHRRHARNFILPLLRRDPRRQPHRGRQLRRHGRRHDRHRQRDRRLRRDRQSIPRRSKWASQG